MAQLRDTKTSHHLATGTPHEMVTLARKIGLDEVVFDDVGEGFDPNATWKGHGAKAAKLPAGMLKDANAALSEARAALEG